MPQHNLEGNYIKLNIEHLNRVYFQIRINHICTEDSRHKHHNVNSALPWLRKLEWFYFYL